MSSATTTPRSFGPSRTSGAVLSGEVIARVGDHASGMRPPSRRSSMAASCRARWWSPPGWPPTATARCSATGVGEADDEALPTASQHSLRKRGLAGVRLVITGAHEALQGRGGPGARRRALAALQRPLRARASRPRSPTVTPRWSRPPSAASPPNPTPPVSSSTPSSACTREQAEHRGDEAPQLLDPLEAADHPAVVDFGAVVHERAAQARRRHHRAAGGRRRWRRARRAQGRRRGAQR